MMKQVFSYFFCIILVSKCLGANFRVTEKQIGEYRNDVVEMFYHAYDGYMQYAYPLDELRPLTCDGHDTWGSYSLTLIDALDTLAVLGNKTEFQRVYHLITERENFDADINVSVFETNIRIVGGLLSAHLLARKMGIDVEPEWPCKGPLLTLAVDAATRLLPAFDTPTGMPYGTVNLRYGVPVGETAITCTAGVATNILEFGTISRLTGDKIFEEVSLRAIDYVWSKRSNIGLVGNHIDVVTGSWTAQDSGIGAGVDSFFEYLVKAGFHLQRPELLAMFNEARTSIDKYLRHEDWHLWASMSRGQITMAVFQSLEAFWPGVLTLVGDVSAAQKTIFNYHQVWKQFGFTPEFFNIAQNYPSLNREGYPLRPELIESTVYLYQATNDERFLNIGADILRSIQHSAKTSCGYATIKNVLDHSLSDVMESFFLAETAKYLYLLFSPDHWIFNRKMTGVRRTVGDKTCFVEAAYFFNSEAHPMDTGALDCCYTKENPIDDFEDLFTSGYTSKSRQTKNVDKNKDLPRAESVSGPETISEPIVAVTIIEESNNVVEEQIEDLTAYVTGTAEFINVKNDSEISPESNETKTENSPEPPQMAENISSSENMDTSRIIPHVEPVKDTRRPFSMDVLRESRAFDMISYIARAENVRLDLLSCFAPSFRDKFIYRGQMAEYEDL